MTTLWRQRHRSVPKLIVGKQILIQGAIIQLMHEFLVKCTHIYKQRPILMTVLALFIIGLTSGLILFPLIIFLWAVAIYYAVYFVKTLRYYKTDEFLGLKKKLSEKIIEYNEFDHFMDETRDFIKQRQSQLTSSNVRHSTLTVYKNSQLDMYRYIVKYFFHSTKVDEETMQIIEAILQKYNTIDKTYAILSDEYTTLMDYVQKHMYRGAYIFQSMTMKKLGSRKLPKFTRDYYMWYSFEYSSPTNRKQYKNTIILDEPRLQDFAQYLNGIIKYQKSAKYQRQLMTPQLRENILSRDHHTCKYCGVSRTAQSHLLLEVDHILPISKGGITAIDNLQSLCWKCNRSKGSKIVDKPALATL